MNMEAVMISILWVAREAMRLPNCRGTGWYSRPV